jgi:hypothetical protein
MPQTGRRQTYVDNVDACSVSIYPDRHHIMTKKNIRTARSLAFNAQNGLCYYCGRPMCPSQDHIPIFADSFHISQACAKALLVTAEHLQARCEGGRDVATNIVAAHALCNRRRHQSKKPMAPQIFCVHVARRCDHGKWFDHYLSIRLASVAQSEKSGDAR